MRALRTLLTAAGLVVIPGLGYVMWSVMAPGEDRRTVLLKSLPESSQTNMDEARKRNALVMQALKEAAKTNDNIMRGCGGTEK